MSCDIGVYGLSVMGQNLALNIASKGFSVAVCNRSSDRVDECIERAEREEVAEKMFGFKDPEEFVSGLKKPRRIIMLLKAGPPVDKTIQKLNEFLEPGDILIDGGNEWYEETIRRSKELEPKGILYMGMGISGGESGARHGPSLMPGGPREAFDAIEPILTKIAAQAEEGPCVTYIGNQGSGNYVKMVHNGIEYGDMQLICEAYDILKHAGFTNEEMAKIFAKWNEEELQSYLYGITVDILRKKDTDIEGLPSSDDYLLDKILDTSGNKGTGKMTVKESTERSVPTPTIATSLYQRFIAADKDTRMEASKLFYAPKFDWSKIQRDQLVEDLKSALYCSKICSYAQGLNLIHKASDELGWGINLGECARIWLGGCIIQAKFLNEIRHAYEADPNLASLFFDPSFRDALIKNQAGWRRIVTLSVATGITCPAICESLSYFDTYRRQHLPSNLIQAQRDYFGGHTFARVDQPSDKMFHCRWTENHA